MNDSKSAPPWPELMTVSEVAAILRVSKMTVYRLVHTEALDWIKVGRSFRIDSSSVRRMLVTGVPSA
jgi:excisionase family DNA binding protein